MTLQIVSDGVTRDFTMTTAFVQYGTSVEVAGFPVDFNWISADTLRLTQAPALGAIITITPNTYGIVTGNTSGISQEALDNSLGNLESSLSSQLGTAGAITGELRVFNADVAPASWKEVDRVMPPDMLFTGGNRSVMCAPRALTSVTTNSHSICIAGEHSGYVYYLVTPGNGYAYLEKMHVASGDTFAVTTHPYSSFAATAGLITTPMCTIVGDYLYAFGGRTTTAGSIILSSTYRINLTNITAGWAQLQSMPNAIVSAGIAVVGTKIYCVGGITNPNTPNTTSLMQVFDTNGLAWSTLSAVIPFGSVENCQAAVMPDGVNIVCVGGWTGGAEVKKYSLFNTSTGQFGTVRDLPSTFADRPRLVFKLPGDPLVYGLGYDGVKPVLLTFNGTAWTDTGIKARFAGNVIGNAALSDGCAFVPATLGSYQVPHAKYAINSAQAVDKRLLCYKL